MSVRRLTARGRPLHVQTFDAGLGSWATATNASALTRDATRDAGSPGTGSASARWTATAAGDSGLTSALIAVPSGIDVLAIVKLWIGGSGSYGARLALDYYDTASNYLQGEYGYSRSGLAAGRWATLVCPLTLPANGGYVQPSIVVFGAAAGQQFWLDNVQVLS